MLMEGGCKRWIGLGGASCLLPLAESATQDDGRWLHRRKAAVAELDDATQSLAVLLVEKAMDEALARRGLA